MSAKEIKGIIIDVILTSVFIGVMHLTNSIPEGYFDKTSLASLAFIGASRVGLFAYKDDSKDRDANEELRAPLLYGA